VSWIYTNAAVTIAPEVGPSTLKGSPRVTRSFQNVHHPPPAAPRFRHRYRAVTVSTPAPPSNTRLGADMNEIFSKSPRTYFDFNKAEIRADARARYTKTAMN